MKFNFKSKTGFTLIELLVVIGILAVLAAIAIPSVAGLIDRANVSADKTNATEMTNAIERFTSEYELYKQDLSSKTIDFNNLDETQSRIFSICKCTTRDDITKFESTGKAGEGINIDTKYPANGRTVVDVIQNYMKTTSSTFEPKQSDMSFYYCPEQGIITIAKTGSKSSDIDVTVTKNEAFVISSQIGDASVQNQWMNLTKYTSGDTVNYVATDNNTYTMLKTTVQELTKDNMLTDFSTVQLSKAPNQISDIIGCDSWGNAVNMDYWTIYQPTSVCGPDGHYSINGPLILQQYKGPIVNGKIVGEVPAYAELNVENLGIVKNKITFMQNVFKNNTELTTAPFIPPAVYYIDNAFNGCTSLTGTVDFSHITALSFFGTAFTNTSKPITVVVSNIDKFISCIPQQSNVTVKSNEKIKMYDEYGNEVDDSLWEYSYATQLCTITKYKGEIIDGTIIGNMPVKINTKPVLYASTFKNNLELTHINRIPVVLALDGTFEGCKNLTGTIEIAGYISGGTNNAFKDTEKQIILKNMSNCPTYVQNTLVTSAKNGNVKWEKEDAYNN